METLITKKRHETCSVPTCDSSIIVLSFKAIVNIVPLIQAGTKPSSSPDICHVGVRGFVHRWGTRSAGPELASPSVKTVQ